MHVTNPLRKLLLMGLALLSLSRASFGQVAISVNFAPPALPVYDLPVCPGDGYIWTPGYWAWDSDDADYYWVPGTWILAPEVGFLWTPPWWGWEGGLWLFHAGWWGPTVGFYGGINYGFGYFGTGFWGGRWEGGHFFYNRTVVTNVVNIHNVYNETINRTIVENHVSFNGGPGGINARATAEEEAAARARHIGAVEAQTRQIDAARANRDLRASVNHGRPSIAATGRPGEFDHPVAAREAGGEYHGNPGGEHGNPAGGRPVGDARDLPAMERPAAPNTGNAKMDQKYQKQQDKLFAKQTQERQKLEQQQEREHQQLDQQKASQEQRQQTEQRHAQQTQQMQERHAQQTQSLQSHFGGGGGGHERR
jgi:hypothetical protein